MSKIGLSFAAINARLQPKTMIEILIGRLRPRLY